MVAFSQENIDVIINSLEKRMSELGHINSKKNVYRKRREISLIP